MRRCDFWYRIGLLHLASCLRLFCESINQFHLHRWSQWQNYCECPSSFTMSPYLLIINSSLASLLPLSFWAWLASLPSLQPYDLFCLFFHLPLQLLPESLLLQTQMRRTLSSFFQLQFCECACHSLLTLLVLPPHCCLHLHCQIVYCTFWLHHLFPAVLFSLTIRLYFSIV